MATTSDNPTVTVEIGDSKHDVELTDDLKDVLRETEVEESIDQLEREQLIERVNELTGGIYNVHYNERPGQVRVVNSSNEVSMDAPHFRNLIEADDVEVVMVRDDRSHAGKGIWVRSTE